MYSFYNQKKVLYKNIVLLMKDVILLSVIPIPVALSGV